MILTTVFYTDKQRLFKVGYSQEENSVLIVNDEHRIAAGIKSLSKRCSFCQKPLSAYPLIMNDDAGFHFFHAACAAALATDIIVDLSTFFHPPAPYRRFFVLTTGEAQCNNEQGGTHAVNEYQRDQGSSLETSAHR